MSTLTSVRPESLDAFGVVRSAELSWHSSCHILQNQNHQIKCLNIADIFFAFLFLKLHRAPTKAFCTGLFLILSSSLKGGDFPSQSVICLYLQFLKNVVVFNSYPNGNVIFYVLFLKIPNSTTYQLLVCRNTIRGSVNFTRTMVPAPTQTRSGKQASNI